MTAYTTLSLGDSLHGILKMIAAARRVGLNDLITELLIQGVQRGLERDQTLQQLVRGVVRRDTCVDDGLRDEILGLLDSIAKE